MLTVFVNSFVVDAEEAFPLTRLAAERERRWNERFIPVFSFSVESIVGKKDKKKTVPDHKGLEDALRRATKLSSLMLNRKSEAGSGPSLFSRFVWKGTPNGSDPLNICGMEFQLRWYASRQDYLADSRECPVCAITVDSVELSEHLGHPRMIYDCTLIEFVAPNDAYGRWLREQRHQGAEPLIDEATRESKDVLITPLKTQFLRRRTTQAERQQHRLLGVELEPHRIVVAGPMLVSPDSSSLSSLQVDRIYEFLAAVSGYGSFAREMLEYRQRKKRRVLALLEELATEIRTKSEALEIAETLVGELERSSKSLTARLNNFERDDETRTHARQTALSAARSDVTRARNEIGRLGGLARQAMRLAMEAVRTHGPTSSQALELGAKLEQARRRAEVEAPAALAKAEEHLRTLEQANGDAPASETRARSSTMAEALMVSGRLEDALKTRQSFESELRDLRLKKVKLDHDLSDLGGADI